MPRLSIVITADDSDQRLESTLVSVLENRPDDCDIFVVHDGSYDDPYELKGEVTFIEVDTTTSWAERSNLALSHCTADVVHLLDCGVSVREGWADLALRHFDNRSVASVAPLVVDLNDPRRVISAGLDYRRSGSRRIVKRVPTSTAKSQNVCGATRTAAFYRRSALEAIGGWTTRVGDRLADVDLALTLQRLGCVSRIEPTSLVLADATEGQNETTFRSGLYAERLYRRHCRDGVGIFTKLVHSAVVAGEAVSCLWRPAKTRRILGRLIALFGTRSDREHRRWLQEIEADESASAPETIAISSARQRIETPRALQNRAA